MEQITFTNATAHLYIDGNGRVAARVEGLLTLDECITLLKAMQQIEQGER